VGLAALEAANTSLAPLQSATSVPFGTLIVFNHLDWTKLAIVLNLEIKMA
jgi:hypothetical protein